LVNGAGMRSQSSMVRRFESCPLHYQLYSATLRQDENQD
jgi:hypothetical protein